MLFEGVMKRREELFSGNLVHAPARFFSVIS
jgi:hypothetical protein